MYTGQDGADIGIRARLLHNAQAIGEDLAVTRPAQLGELHLTTSVAHCLHGLGACLVPSHRPPQFPSEQRDHDFFARHSDLHAEATTDIRCTQADRRGLTSEVHGKCVANAVRSLGRCPVEQAIALPLTDGAARLERAGGNAAVHDSLPNDHFASSEEVVIVGGFAHNRDDVRAGFGEQQWRVVGQRGFDIHDCRPRAVVDHDESRGVDGFGVRLRDNYCDRFTDEAHDAIGEPGPDDRDGEHRRDVRIRNRCQSEIGKGEDAEDAVRSARLGRIDGTDGGVGHGRAHEHGMHPGAPPPIGKIAATTRQQTLIFDSVHPRSHEAHGRESTVSGGLHAGCRGARKDRTVHGWVLRR